VNDCFEGRPKAEPVSILLAQVLSDGKRLTKPFFQTVLAERVVSLRTCADNVSSPRL
jgi:hypothetical protein